MSSIKAACDIYWAYTDKVSDLSNKYEITLANLSDAAVTNLKGMGIEVRFREDKPEQGNFITCKSVLPIELLDTSGNKLDVVLGNGSKGIATISPYEWTWKNMSGVSPSLKKLVVTEVVRFGDEGSDDDAPVF